MQRPLKKIDKLEDYIKDVNQLLQDQGNKFILLDDYQIAFSPKNISSYMVKITVKNVLKVISKGAENALN